MSPHPSVTARAPAKINIALIVGPPRADGFHPLSTVYQAISLYDTVEASWAEDITVSVTGRHTDLVPLDDANLAVQAARLLAERAGVRMGVHLTISKDIPVAAGLAGGSADAAASLVACNELWGTRLPRDELMTLAAELGSDVPFALHGHTALGSGRGELVTEVLARGSYDWVVITQRRGLATPEMFARLDARKAGKSWSDPAVSPRLLRALRAGDPKALAASVHNDLQAIAMTMRPELSEVREAAWRAGAVAAFMTGSGPTMIALAQSHEHAVSMTDALRGQDILDEAFVAYGPVGGAKVV